MSYSTRISLRGDTASNWSTVNPILYQREVGIDTTNNRIKIGNGTSTWTQLPYVHEVFIVSGVPVVSDSVKGDICYDSLHDDLYIWNGSSFIQLVDIADLNRKILRHYEGFYLDSYTSEQDAINNIVLLGKTANNETTRENNIGDTVVIKTKLKDNSGNLLNPEVVTYKAFVWSLSNLSNYSSGTWMAMDGNYDATNVYFKNDLIITKDVGVQKIPSGQTNLTVPFKGKNVYDALKTLFAVEENPVTTQPSMSISILSSGVAEVGEEYTPRWKAVLNPGSYTYNPSATGITASSFQLEEKRKSANSYSVITTTTSGTYTIGNTIEATYTSQGKFRMEDDTKFSLRGTFSYSDAPNTPCTNLGTPYPSGKILGSSVSGTSGTVGAYRKWFVGAATINALIVDSNNIALGGNMTGYVNSNAINSSIIRGLVCGSSSTNTTNISGFNRNSYSKVYVKITNTTSNCIIIAVPTDASKSDTKYTGSVLGKANNTASLTVGDASKVNKIDGMTVSCGSSFVKYKYETGQTSRNTVTVLDAHGENPMGYDLWIYWNNTPLTQGNTYEIQL